MQYLNTLKIIPGLQATSLAVRSIPKGIPMKPYKKINPDKMFQPKRINNNHLKVSKNFVKGGIGILVGLGLIAGTVAIINNS